MIQRFPFLTRNAVWVIGLFVTVFLIDIFSPTAASFDSRWTVPTALSFADHGSTNVDPYVTQTKDPDNARFPGLYLDYAIECVTNDGTIVRGEACPGHYYNWYPAAVPIMASPIVFALRAGMSVLSPLLIRLTDQDSTPVLKGFFTGDFIQSRVLVEVVTASFFVALTAVIIFLTGRLFLPPTKAAVLALIFAFATPAWSTASRALMQHGPSMLMLSTSLYLLLLAHESASTHKALLISLSAIPTALAYAIRPTNSLWVVAVTIYVLVHYRRYFASYLLCVVPIAVAFLIYNESVYRRILPTYFVLKPGQPSFPGDVLPMGVAFLGELISPARGLLIYSPIFFFSVWGMVWAIRHRWCGSLTPYLIGFTIGNVLLVAYYFRLWWGGHSYGPRLLADLTPFCVFFLVPLFMNSRALKWPFRPLPVLFMLAVVVSVFVHSRGALYADGYMWNVVPNDVDENQSRLWDWGDPPFLRGLSWKSSSRALSQNLPRTEGRPLYSVDQAAILDQGELQTGIFASRIFLVAGWAADPSQGLTGGVEVVVDGQAYPAMYGLQRPDVAAYFKNPSYENAGFLLSMPAGRLSHGAHQFSVRILAKDKTSYFESPSSIAAYQPSTTTPVASTPTVAPPPATKPTDRAEIEGSLDLVDAQQIAGWAWDRAHPEDVVPVEIYDGTTLLSTVPADRFRQDLLEAHKGNGTHGFVSPHAFDSNGRHTIHALALGKELVGSPKALPLSR
jgi:hypothetical protein